MSITVGQFVMERLTQWGVERIYAYPGDGINGLLAGERRNDGKPRFIQPGTKAGRLHGLGPRQVHWHGRCLHGHQRTGAIHLLNGLYDAKMDHQPVVAIVGQSATTAVGTSINRRSICRRSSKTWRASTVVTVMSAGRRATLHRPRLPHRAGPA